MMANWTECMEVDMETEEIAKPFSIHNHTNDSDGIPSFCDAVLYAYLNDFDTLSISDHNYISIEEPMDLFDLKLKDLKKPCHVFSADAFLEKFGKYPIALNFFENKYANLDGLKSKIKGKKLNYIFSCEFTAYHNDNKYHFLVVAPRLDEYNSFVELMRIKRNNDISSDLAMIAFLFKYKGLRFPKEEVGLYRSRQSNYRNGVSPFTKESTLDFFNENPELLEKLGFSEDDLKIILDFIDPTEKINIDAKMLFDIAHLCGAKVFMAHPGLNLQEASDWKAEVRYFIEIGIDGFNILEYPHEEINSYIKKVCDAENPKRVFPLILYVGGNDCHTYKDYIVQDFTYFNNKKCATFLSYIKDHSYFGLNISNFNLIYPSVDREYTTKYLNDLKNVSTNIYDSFARKLSNYLERKQLRNFLADCRMKGKADTYYSQKVIKKLFGDTLSPEIYDYLMEQKITNLQTIEEILGSSFVIPKSKGSTPSTKRNMVSKNASGGRIPYSDIKKKNIQKHGKNTARHQEHSLNIKR